MRFIAKCFNGHYFVYIADRCPFCDATVETTVEYRDGDCVSCGALCPVFALSCNSPSLITWDELMMADRYRQLA
jgi:LITAF-like zinc ribbon domain